MIAHIAKNAMYAPPAISGPHLVKNCLVFPSNIRFVPISFPNLLILNVIFHEVSALL
jgi:hypothetical protein